MDDPDLLDESCRVVRSYSSCCGAVVKSSGSNEITAILPLLLFAVVVAATVAAVVTVVFPNNDFGDDVGDGKKLFISSLMTAPSVDRIGSWMASTLDDTVVLGSLDDFFFLLLLLFLRTLLLLLRLDDVSSSSSFPVLDLFRLIFFCFFFEEDFVRSGFVLLLSLFALCNSVAVEASGGVADVELFFCPESAILRKMDRDRDRERLASSLLHDSRRGVDGGQSFFFLSFFFLRLTDNDRDRDRQRLLSCPSPCFLPREDREVTPATACAIMAESPTSSSSSSLMSTSSSHVVEVV